MLVMLKTIILKKKTQAAYSDGYYIQDENEDDDLRVTSTMVVSLRGSVGVQ